LHPSALASHGPSNVHCKPSLDIYRNPQWHTFSVFSFFHCLLCPLCLCRMGQAMSTATRLWIFIAALSSTCFRCTYVARITSYDHPLLYRSKQLRRTDSKVDTTCVACCTFPFFCLFFTITMNSRDNPCVVQPDMHNLADCQCIYQLPLPRLRDNHACGTEVEFVSFSLDKIFGHHHIYAVQLRSCR
jgi:hypothetical protein